MIKNTDPNDTLEMTSPPLDGFHPNTIVLAEIGYNAYGEKAGWKTYDFKPMPTWEKLGVIVQERWCAATDAITDAYLEGETC